MITFECGTALVTGGNRGIGRAVVRELDRGFGRLDCLVANAGSWPPDEAPMARLPEEPCPAAPLPRLQ